LADAIADQVRRLAYANPFTDMGNVLAIELCEKLVELAPGSLNHTMLSTGGSTAVDTAFRLVQYYQRCRGLNDKRQIISRADAYHGMTYAAASIGGKPADHPDEFEFITDNIHHLSSPNHYRHGVGQTEQQFAAGLVDEFVALIES
jgi:putrescine---pyruvate transaminase